MKKVFVSSRFRGDTHANIETAKDLAREVMQMGHIPKPEVKPEVPIQNYYYLFGAIIREAIKDYARYRYFDERGQVVFPDREGVLHYATAKQYLFHPDYLEYTLKKTMIGDHLNIEYIRRKAIEAFQYCMDNDTPDLDWYLTVIKV